MFISFFLISIKTTFLPTSGQISSISENFGSRLRRYLVQKSNWQCALSWIFTHVYIYVGGLQMSLCQLGYHNLSGMDTRNPIQ